MLRRTLGSLIGFQVTDQSSCQRYDIRVLDVFLVKLITMLALHTRSVSKDTAKADLIAEEQESCWIFVIHLAQEEVDVKGAIECKSVGE